MKTSHRMLAMAALCLGATAAQAQKAKVNCDTKATVTNLQKASQLGSFAVADVSSCTSLRNVLARLFGSSSSAGKKLEPDKALNVAAATKERQDALTNPALAADLKELLAGETDPLRKLVLEAAVHEDYGYYAARDLVLHEAHKLIGK